MWHVCRRRQCCEEIGRCSLLFIDGPAEGLGDQASIAVVLRGDTEPAAPAVVAPVVLPVYELACSTAEEEGGGVVM